MTLSKDPFCNLPFQRARITCEGDVYFCCFQRWESLGNLKSAEFDEIWFSPLAEEIRAETLAGRLHSRCDIEGCPHRYGKTLSPATPRASELPRSLEIDLPNTDCNVGGKRPNEKNQPCLMCERSAPGYKFQTVDLLPSVLPKLRHLVPQLWHIHVQGVAEAFWHDRMFEVLDLLDFDRYKNQIFVSTTTNGVVFDRERQRRFKERCPKSSVTFSLDASTPETYRKIRRLNVYDRVVSNLLAYSVGRSPTTRLRIHNNINLINVGEVTGMVRVAAEAKVDVIEFNATMGYKLDIRLNQENAPLFKAAQEAALEEGRRLGVKVEFMRPLDLGMAP